MFQLHFPLANLESSRNRGDLGILDPDGRVEERLALPVDELANGILKQQVELS